MTRETITAFIQYETERGASENAIRRYKGTLRVLYEFLPEDKCITRERLLAWRKSMEESGYATITIQNYVKYINRYLDYVGCSEIRFQKGKAKDLTGLTFGYLKAIELTGEKERGDNVWLFQCKCGNTITLPATRVLNNNTLSCGCLKGATLRESRKYYDGTSITQSMTEVIESKYSASGYTGVSRKRDKWQAHITYKGVHYSLGCYGDMEDAVKARARAKELVMADAKGLLDFYEELEKTFSKKPNRHTEPKKEFPQPIKVINDDPVLTAVRSNNSSGYKGVSRSKGKWSASICFQGIRYYLGNFEEKEDAVCARQTAEQLLKKDKETFLEVYSKYRHYHI